jgi:hypothetical protein
MTTSEKAWANYNEIRASMVLPKTNDDLLCINLGNRSKPEHTSIYHGPKLNKTTHHKHPKARE